MRRTNKDRFSKGNPDLQVVWSPSSLEKFMIDPATYRLKKLLGWHRPEPNAAMIFGSLYHEAVEIYDVQRHQGRSKEDALYRALRYAYCEAMAQDLQLAAELGKKQDRNKRTPWTLLRSIVWYAEDFGDDDDPLRMLTMPNGEPASEVEFMIPLDIKTPYGENYVISGILDGIVDLDGNRLIRERKTTTGTVSKHFLKRYKLNPQISTYALAGEVMGYGTEGVLVEVLQSGVNFSRITRSMIHRTASQNEEWLNDLQWWIKQAERCAETGRWPINQATQLVYGGNDFLEILAKDPSVRENFLATDYTREDNDV